MNWDRSLILFDACRSNGHESTCFSTTPWRGLALTRVQKSFLLIALFSSSSEVDMGKDKRRKWEGSECFHAWFGWNFAKMPRSTLYFYIPAYTWFPKKTPVSQNLKIFLIRKAKKIENIDFIYFSNWRFLWETLYMYNIYTYIVPFYTFL